MSNLWWCHHYSDDVITNLTICLSCSKELLSCQIWRLQNLKSQSYCWRNPTTQPPIPTPKPLDLIKSLAWIEFWGEWPSGLRRCNQNRKVPGSKSARRLTRLRKPTSLRDSWWPSGQTCTNAVINIGLVRLPPWEWPKVGRGTAK